VVYFCLSRVGHLNGSNLCRWLFAVFDGRLFIFTASDIVDVATVVVIAVHQHSVLTIFMLE